MNAKYRRLLSALVLVWTPAALLMPLCAYAQPFYTVTLIPVGPYATPIAINYSGEIVGTGATGNAFLYSNGNVTAVSIDPNGINSLGQIVGTTDHQAAIYNNGSVQLLGTLPDSSGEDGSGPFSVGYAINDHGQVTGYSSAYTQYPGQPPAHAFLYSDDIMMDLGTLGSPQSGVGVPDSIGTDINNLGQVTGWTNTKNGVGIIAFLYSNGVMRAIGTLGGTYSAGTAINSAGQVVGYSADKSDGQALAFLYSNGKMQGLGTLGGLFSVANGINDSGEVVGVSDTGKSGFEPSDAFVYIDGSMYNLNSLIGNADSAIWLTSAAAINDQGQIIAEGFNIANGERYAYLLTPTDTTPVCRSLCEVSEPGTLALFGLGLSGLCLTLCRRNRYA